jgi:predicted metal-binding membrane protein
MQEQRLPSAGTVLEAVLKQDRALLLGGLVSISLLAWAYTAHMAHHLMQMDMAMPHMHRWGVWDLVLLFVMWVIMMIAMMIPTAAPAILMFATMRRRHREQSQPFVPTAVFVLGYLLVWTAYSLLATVVQWGLHTAALLSPTMVSTSSVLGGVLLVAAGIFQWTPLKHACLAHCRSPLGFFMTNWRDGTAGTLVMGLQHGGYCVGCCWVLMALLFVAGMMNLLWVAAMTAFILIEKVLPHGQLVGRLAGGLLVLAGLGFMVRG